MKKNTRKSRKVPKTPKEPHMAKQNIHEKLGITFHELLALYGVREALKQGAIVHKHRPAGALTATEVCADIENAHVFNMAYPGNTNAKCGSVACIGGYMALVMGLDMFKYVHSNWWGDNTKTKSHSLALRPLFWPMHLQLDPITPSQAVMAIDRFLAGKVPWPPRKAAR